MAAFPPSLLQLVRELSKLPSIGEKSATRLAYHLINNQRNNVGALVLALQNASTKIKHCNKCFFLCEDELCEICRNPARDESVVCVVERPMELVAIEKMGEFKGLYHVLHGLWAPLRGQGPDSMKIKELLDRTREGKIKEVIVATNSTVEGDATALFIAKQLAALGIKTSRLAQGIPKGGELEYADEVTLSRAFLGRSSLEAA